MMTVNVQHIHLGQFGKVGDKEVNDTDFTDPVPTKFFLVLCLWIYLHWKALSTCP